MKTEEILRYQAEYEAMAEALGAKFLVFEFLRPTQGNESPQDKMRLDLSGKSRSLSSLDTSRD
jgi:hypothetical protein